MTRLKVKEREDLFAATPPLESTKLMFRMVVAVRESCGEGTMFYRREEGPVERKVRGRGCGWSCLRRSESMGHTRGCGDGFTECRKRPRSWRVKGFAEIVRLVVSLKCKTPVIFVFFFGFLRLHLFLVFFVASYVFILFFPSTPSFPSRCFHLFPFDFSCLFPFVFSVLCPCVRCPFVSLLPLGVLSRLTTMPPTRRGFGPGHGPYTAPAPSPKAPFFSSSVAAQAHAHREHCTTCAGLSQKKRGSRTVGKFCVPWLSPSSTPCVLAVVAVYLAPVRSQATPDPLFEKTIRAFFVP